MEKNQQADRRINFSRWVRLIIKADGTFALWQGSNRVELSQYDAMRLCNALLAEFNPPDRIA